MNKCKDKESGNFFQLLKRQKPVLQGHTCGVEVCHLQEASDHASQVMGMLWAHMYQNLEIRVVS